MQAKLSSYERTKHGFVYEFCDQELELMPKGELLVCNIHSEVNLNELCDIAVKNGADSVLFAETEAGDLSAFIAKEWSQEPIDVTDSETDIRNQLVKVSDLLIIADQLDRDVYIECNDDGEFFIL